MELAQEILGVSAAKTELPGRLRKLSRGELERVVIVRQNSPVAVILTVEEYERMSQQVTDLELLDDLRELISALEKDDGHPYQLGRRKGKARAVTPRTCDCRPPPTRLY